MPAANTPSIHFAETLLLEGIAASIGSIGDAYDNALAESTIGLFKNEAIREDSPFRTGPLRTVDDVEWVTMAWVDWYNRSTTPLSARERSARRARGRLLR